MKHSTVPDDDFGQLCIQNERITLFTKVEELEGRSELLQGKLIGLQYRTTTWI